MNDTRLQTRECHWCRAPITGRADKRFCTNSCKAHYSRAVPPEPFSVPKHKIPAYQLIDLPVQGHLWNTADNEVEDEKWSAILAQAREEQAKRDPLHHRYADVVEHFLRTEEIGQSFTLIDQSIEEVLRTIDCYLNHPGLRIRGHVAHHRLFDLYLVHDYLQELREVMSEVVWEGQRHDGTPSSPEDVSLDLPDRRRRSFWANIIGTSTYNR